MLSSPIYYTEWDEISYPFANFNDATVEVSESMCNFLPHFAGHVITHPG